MSLFSPVSSKCHVFWYMSLSRNPSMIYIGWEWWPQVWHLQRHRVASLDLWFLCNGRKNWYMFLIFIVWCSEITILCATFKEDHCSTAVIGTVSIHCFLLGAVHVASAYFHGGDLYFITWSCVLVDPWWMWSLSSNYIVVNVVFSFFRCNFSSRIGFLLYQKES